MRNSMSALRAGMSVLALLGAATKAEAQASALCATYASRAVQTYQEGLLKSCNMGRSGLSGDYGRMIAKCRNWPDVRTRSELNALPRVQALACKAPAPRTAPGPKPAAAPRPAGADNSRAPVCSSYARHAANHDRYFMNRGCRLPAVMLNGDERGYMERCMRTSDAEFRVRSPVAGGNLAILRKHCGFR